MSSTLVVGKNYGVKDASGRGAPSFSVHQIKKLCLQSIEAFPALKVSTVSILGCPEYFSWFAAHSFFPLYSPLSICGITEISTQK